MTVIDQLIPLADAHQAADEYRAGRYEVEDDGDGLGACGIGCTIHDAITLGVLPPETDPGDHEALSAAIGVPEWALRLLDSVFERLPVEHRPPLTPAFLRRARHVGNWERVKAGFLVSLLARASQHDPSDCCATVAALWRRVLAGESVDALRAEFAEAARAVLAAVAWEAAARALLAAVAREAAAAAWSARAALSAAAWAVGAWAASEEGAAAEALAQRDDLFSAMEAEAEAV